MDASVTSAIESVKDGSFAGGMWVGTLANNGVRIAPYHDLAGAVSSELNSEIQAIKAGIIDGSISVKN